MNPDGSFISIVTKSKVARMPIAEIEWVEQSGRKLLIYTSYGEFESYEKIESIAPLLVEMGFYRPMKSMIINFDKVIQMGDGEITFSSGKSVCMGRNNYSSARKAFRSYVMQYPPFAEWAPRSILAEKVEKTVL